MFIVPLMKNKLMMRSLKILCLLFILGSCAKDDAVPLVQVAPSLEEQILDKTQNQLFLDALACSDIDLNGQEFTLLVPGEDALNQFLIDLNAKDFSEVKQNIGATYYNAWLGSHILPQAVKVENLRTAFVPTLAKNSENQDIYLHLLHNKGLLRINGQWITVGEKDLELSSGIIHSIDQVLYPSTLSKLVRSNMANFSILERALRVSNLASMLNNDQSKFTFLAPNDQAFDAFFQAKDCGDLDGYIEEFGVLKLKELIEAHLITGSHKLSQLVGSQQSSLALNAGLNIYLEDGNILVQRNGLANAKSAHVLLTDISSFNGSLNIIDEVLKLP